jgi:hypothetical protein
LETFVKVDAEQLDLRLADTGARQECPSCAGVKWTVDDDPAAVNATDGNTGELLLDTALEAAVMVCRNCGFVRLHATRVLFGADS